MCAHFRGFNFRGCCLPAKISSQQNYLHLRYMVVCFQCSPTANFTKRNNSRSLQGAAAVQQFYCVLVCVHAGTGGLTKKVVVMHVFVHVQYIKPLTNLAASEVGII